MARILIVDDEERIRQIVAVLLLDQGHHVMEAVSGEEALERLESFPADLVLLDLNLPGIDGIETLRLLRQRHPKTVVVLMTAFATVSSAVEAMRLGAFDYVSKPFNNDEFRLTVGRALQMQRLDREVEHLRGKLETAYGFNEMIGISPAIQEVFRKITRVAPVNATVLITGESGTGKELVAQAIHRRSTRSEASFVAVNCSAIPQALVESEFFGHEKGAFTGAHARRIGRFEEAQGGTLFLDEIGDLPLEAQAKLLRALQERQIQPVGGGLPRSVDVRVIAATNKDLAREVENGQFREDLFWRLNVVPIKLPPLRDRAEDLSLLIDYFVERFNQELGLGLRAIAPDARQSLQQYGWPGNIRELENTLCRSMILCDGSVLTLADLPSRVRGLRSSDQEAPGVEAGDMTLAEAVQRATERVEQRMIVSRLAALKGNRTATAKSLGISRKTLFNKMRQLRLPEA